MTRVRAGWAATLLLVAALGLAGSYRGVLAPLLVTLAVVAPFAVAALGQRLRVGAATALLGLVVVAAALGWWALRSDGIAVADALPRLLTVARPAPATGALLVPVVLATLVVAALVAAVVVGARRADAALLAPVVGAVVVYGAGQLLSAGTSDRHGLTAVALLIIAAGGWSQPYLRGVLGSVPAGAAGGTAVAWRPVAVVPVVVVSLAALGVGTLVPAGAFDPREHVTPPTVRLARTSPLVQLRSWLANPDVRILRAKVSGTDRLQLATLDTFTGAAWQLDARYQQLGLVRRGALPPGQRQQRVRATVSIERLGGLWLPGAGFATASSLDDVLVDPDDGTLARPGRVGPGLVYDLDARRDAPTSRQLSVAAVPTSVPARYLALPNAPAGFSQYARAAVRGASTPLEEAIALENAVSSGRRVDPKAASGSSYGRLQTFLFGRAGTAGARVGSAEQFAAAFALLAREVGLPSRLVVGFDLTGATHSSGGTVTVRGRDATAWPEVYLAGAGWVPFSPTPGADGDSGGSALRDDVLQRLSRRAEQAPPPAPLPSVAPTAAPPSRAAKADPSGPPAGTPGWLLGLGAVGIVALLAVASLAVLRLLRTRRHRARGARGAWAEVVDLLILVGRRPAAHRPAPQVAADVEELFGEPVAVIAAAADREAFAPDAESSPPVWGHLRVLRRRARASLPPHRRVLLPLDPRPLVRR